MVEVRRIAVRHNHAVESDGHATLLTEAYRADLLCLSQHNRSFWDEHMLVIVGVDRIRDEYLHRTYRVAIEAIHQNRVHCQTFIDHIRLSHGGVDVYPRDMLDRCLSGWWLRRLARSAWCDKAAAGLSR